MAKDTGQKSFPYCHTLRKLGEILDVASNAYTPKLITWGNREEVEEESHFYSPDKISILFTRSNLFPLLCVLQHHLNSPLIVPIYWKHYAETFAIFSGTEGTV